jgi:hypothetical protein
MFSVSQTNRNRRPKIAKQKNKSRIKNPEEKQEGKTNIPTVICAGPPISRTERGIGIAPYTRFNQTKRTCCIPPPPVTKTKQTPAQPNSAAAAEPDGAPLCAEEGPGTWCEVAAVDRPCSQRVLAGGGLSPSIPRWSGKCLIHC